MHDQACLNTFEARGTSADVAPAEGGAVEYDQAVTEAVSRLDEAADRIRDLQTVLAIWPEREALVDEHMRALCTALGQAFEARARFLARHAFLAGLAPINPS